MRDASFTLDPAAEMARPPFSYDEVASPRAHFWKVREASGRPVGRAKTRAGARAAVRTLYDAATLLFAFTLMGCSETYYHCRQQGRGRDDCTMSTPRLGGAS